MGTRAVLVPNSHLSPAKGQRIGRGSRWSLRAVIGSTMCHSDCSGPKPRPACHAEGHGFESRHPVLLSLSLSLSSESSLSPLSSLLFLLLLLAENHGSAERVGVDHRPLRCPAR